MFQAEGTEGELGERGVERLGKGPIMLGQLDCDAKFGFYSKWNRKPPRGYKARST